jgi:hypothetical protein
MLVATIAIALSLIFAKAQSGSEFFSLGLQYLLMEGSYWRRLPYNLALPQLVVAHNSGRMTFWVG